MSTYAFAGYAYFGNESDGFVYAMTNGSSDTPGTAVVVVNGVSKATNLFSFLFLAASGVLCLVLFITIAANFCCQQRVAGLEETYWRLQHAYAGVSDVVKREVVRRTPAQQQRKQSMKRATSSNSVRSAAAAAAPPQPQRQPSMKRATSSNSVRAAAAAAPPQQQRQPSMRQPSMRQQPPAPAPPPAAAVYDYSAMYAPEPVAQGPPAHQAGGADDSVYAYGYDNTGGNPYDYSNMYAPAAPPQPQAPVEEPQASDTLRRRASKVRFVGAT